MTDLKGACPFTEPEVIDHIYIYSLQSAVCRSCLEFALHSHSVFDEVVMELGEILR